MRHYIRFDVKCADNEYNFSVWHGICIIEENDTDYELF